MKKYSVALFAAASLLLASHEALIAQQANLPPFKKKIPELLQSRQLIIVTTQEWNDVPAQIDFLERTTELQPWRKALSSCPSVVERYGLSWGIGVHGGPPKNSARSKHEGDLCSPAGIFELGEVFGYVTPKEAALTTFSYRQITSTMEAVDDPHSCYYNRIVDTTAIDDKDWNSSEIMLRHDDLYRWGVVVKNNWKPYPDDGSAIFLHIWRSSEQGTAGCTAMAPENILKFIRWLDTTKYPLLVQLPSAEYERLKFSWHLP